MAVNLQWFLKTPPTPTPENVPFVPAVTSSSVGPGVGEVALGCGVLVPFKRNGKGDFSNSCGVEIIKSSVSQILGVNSRTDTSYGDIEWRPEFGSVVNRLRHLPANEGTAALARHYVVDALRIWEPRIRIVDASVAYEVITAPGANNGTALVISLLYDIVGQKRNTGALVPNVNQQLTLTNFAEAA